MPPRLVIGCNYHTTWQSRKGMRFVLVAVKGTRARLKTRKTGADFYTHMNDLIFIETQYNKEKAEKLLQKQEETKMT